MRVQAVTDRARLINFSSHPFSGIVRPNDAHGVCHHLQMKIELIGWILLMNKNDILNSSVEIALRILTLLSAFP